MPLLKYHFTDNTGKHTVWKKDYDADPEGFAKAYPNARFEVINRKTGTRGDVAVNDLPAARGEGYDLFTVGYGGTPKAQKPQPKILQAAQNVAAEKWGGKPKPLGGNVVNGRNGSNAAGRESELVRGLRSADAAVGQQAVDYTKPGAVRQMVRQTKARQAVQGTAVESAGRAAGSNAMSAVRRKESPAFDTGNANVNANVVKTRGQLNDELAASGRDLADRYFDAYTNNSIFGEFNNAKERGSRAEAALQQSSPWAYMAAGKAYNEALDPDKLMARLSEKASVDLQGLLNNPGVQEEISHNAAVYGVSPEDYVNNVLAPSLQKKIAESFENSEIARNMPKNTAEYILRGVNESMLGTIASMGMTSKAQRQYAQQGMAMTDEGLNPDVNPGMGARVLRQTAAFAGDAPVFGALGKAGAAAARGIMGGGLVQGMRVANTSLAGRIGRMAAAGAVSQGVTGVLYGATNAAVQNYSTGDDTSIGNTVKLMAKGGVSEGASWATMGAIGGAVGAGIYNVSGVKRIPAKVFQVAMEGIGMHLGGNVAKTIEGEDTDWLSLEANLEACANVVALKLTHASLPKRMELDGKKESYADYVARKIADFTTSDAERAKGYAFTDEEKEQLFGSGHGPERKEDIYGYDKNDNPLTRKESLTSWAMRTKRMKSEHKDSGTDAEFVKTAYDEIMADNSIPWDTKAKFSALVMGTAPTSRPMMDTTRLEKDGRGRFVGEYSKNGELLSKRYYSSGEECQAIVDSLRMRRDDQRLSNAYGAAQVKDEAGAEATLEAVGKQYGYTADEMKKIMDKDPLRRSDMEQEACTALRKAYEDEQFTAGTLHPEQSQTEGKDVVEENGLGTENPNSDAVVDVLTDLEAKKKAFEESLAGNDTLKQEYERLSKAGLSEPEIYMGLAESGLRPEELAPLADYINAQNKASGMYNGTQQKIIENVQRHLEKWSYKGELNGEKQDGTQMVFVRDGNGRVLMVGAGDMAFDAEGRARDTVGDMLTVTDTATGEMDFVKVTDVTLDHVEKSEDYAKRYQEQLEVKNSEGYVANGSNERTEAGESSSSPSSKPSEGSLGLSTPEGNGENAVPKKETERAMSNEEYEMVEPELAWRAILGRAGGDEALARKAVESVIAEKDAALKKLEKTSAKAGATVAETIDNERARQSLIDEAKRKLEHWQKMLPPEEPVEAEPVFDVAKSLQGKIGKSLSEEESASLAEEMESRAEKARELPLTPENWEAEFGADGKVQTPLGEVKMGENQLEKLFAKGRSKEFSMVKPTLSDPDVVVEVPSTAKDGEAERETSFLFIKTFKKPNGEKTYYFKSVTIKKDGIEISVSSHYDRKKRVEEALKNGKLLYLKQGGAQTEQSQPSVSGTTFREVMAGLKSKDSEKSADGGENKESLTSADGIPLDKDGEPQYESVAKEKTVESLYGTFDTPEEAAAFVEAKVEEAKKRVDSLTKKAPKVGTKVTEYKRKKAEWKASMDDAERRKGYWDSVKDEIARLTHTTEEENKAAENELNGKNAEAEYKEQNPEPEPSGPQNVAAKFMYSAKVTPESFRAETGLGTAEQKGFLGMIAKEASGGKSIARLAEELVELDNNDYGGRYFGGDDQQARNAIISVLTTAKSRGDIKDMASPDVKAYIEQRAAERDAFFNESFGMGYEEYLTYSSIEMPEILRKYSNFDEQAFYDEYAADITNQIDKEYGTVDRRPEEEPGVGGSPEVLHGERAGDEGRSEGGEEPGGEVPAERGSGASETAVDAEARGERLDGGDSAADGSKPSEASLGLSKPVRNESDGGEEKSRYQNADSKAQADKREAALRDVVVERLREAGMDVSMDAEEGQRMLDEANGKAKMSAKKRRALETASVSHDEKHQPTVVSSADGAKVLKELDTTIENYENRANRPKTFLGDTAKALGAAQDGSASEYATFETRNGRIVTIRLANHSATVSNFDHRGESDGISIVVSSKGNSGITNDGEAHVVEYYYDAIKLRRADGKPLADILRSIKQALYSGEFTDTTGLAERQEVNAVDVARYQKVYHGSGADFDHFDHSHMGEGEGAQVFGWGTYVTEVEGIGRTYAEQNSKKFDNPVVQNMVVRMQDMMAEGKTFEEAKSEALERMRTTYEKVKGRDGYESFTADYEKLKSMKESEFQNRHLYTVEIPDDTGKNYLDWDKPLSEALVEKVAKALPSLNKFDIKRLKGNGTGEDLYRTISMRLAGDEFKNDKKASEFLSSLGFTGIKYPADFMRGGREDGKLNYVIFNEADAKITDHVRFFRTADGEAYGYTIGGKIYIDPRVANSETPIHEYAHLWGTALRNGNAKEWNNVVELMKDTKVWDEVKKRYPELEAEDDIADEVLATYSGRRGAKRLRKEMGGADGDAKGALARVKEAIRKFWKATADMLHIHYTSAENVADRVMKDLLDGVDPRKFSASPIEGMEKAAEAWRKERAAQKKSGEESKGSEELFVSLQNKKGKEYYDTVDILSKRVADGRADLYGVSARAGQKAEGRISSGIEIIAASRERQHASGTAKSNESKLRLGRAATENAIEEWAKANGALYSEADIAGKSRGGKPVAEGGEAVVYISEDASKVTKLVDPYQRNKSSVQMCMENTRLFNELFPETAYKVTGVARDRNGKFRIVMEQPFVSGKTYDAASMSAYEAGPSQAKDALMESLGLHDVYGDGLEFKNDKYYASDLHYGNVVFDTDGKPHVIDADVKYYGEYRRKNIEGKEIVQDREPAVHGEQGKQYAEENVDSSEKLFASLRDKKGKEYYDTVTELARRIEQGTARLVREGETVESDRGRHGAESVPAVAGKILNAAYRESNGQSGSLVRETPNEQGKTGIPFDTIYERIEKWAKDNNFYFNESDIERGSYDGKPWNTDGCESVVYRSKDGKHVIKVTPMGTVLADSISYYIDRNKYFNDVFPDSAIEIIGYGRDKNGNPSIITKQPIFEGETVGEHFDGDTKKSLAYIDNYLKSIGLGERPKRPAEKELDLDADGGNDKYAVFDVNPGNVIIDKDGKNHVIDAEVLPLNYNEVGSVKISDASKEKDHKPLWASLGLSKPGRKSGEDSGAEAGDYGDGSEKIRFHRVSDKDELERLDKEKTFRMYSGMQEVDGKLYSPMAAIIGGKRADATEIGAWMKADERPDLVKNGKFNLVKTDGKKRLGEGDVAAAYNPYMHTSSSVMNDQFTGAYARGNIKVVEWEIPESEKTSGYHAEGAKDSVGIVPWHSGTVNGLLPKDRQRSVMLSQYRKAVRVVPDSEVAEKIAGQLKGTGLAIPWNVVTPEQLKELAMRGVPVTTVASGTQAPETVAKFEAQKAELEKEFPQSRFVDLTMTKAAYKEWGKNGGTHYRVEDNLADVNREFNEHLDSLVKDPTQKGRELQLGRPGQFLRDAGMGDAEIVLDYDKLVRKASEKYRNSHPFSTDDIKDLPIAINDAIAVFDNTNGENRGKVILTELQKDGKNFVVAVRASERHHKGGVVLEVNEIRTLFPKESRGIVNWLNTDKASNINKEKALAWLGALRTHRGTELTEQELSDAAKVVNDFDIAKKRKVNYRIGEDDGDKPLWVSLGLSTPGSNASRTSARIEATVEKVAKKTGAKVNVVHSADEIYDERVRKDIESGKQVTGWYDEKTGEVHLYMPNVHDTYTAEKTVWHETVGHKGMRGLLGDKFDSYMRSLWMDLDNPVNKELRAFVRERMTYNHLGFYDAIEECLAKSAEDGKGEPGFWNYIKNKVTDALHEIGYRVSPNVKDVKYMLWLAKIQQKIENQ